MVFIAIYETIHQLAHSTSNKRVPPDSLLPDNPQVNRQGHDLEIDRGQGHYHINRYILAI
jgi:hypothetical protein